MSASTVIGRILEHRRVPLVLAVLAAAIGLAMAHHVYPDLSWNRDEPVFRWQADLLLDGRLTQTDGGHPEVLRPWLSAHHDGRFFGQYPLGWPTIIAGATLLGSSVLAPALGAVLFVLGGRSLALELGGSRRRANATGVLLLASPILAVQGGVHLNYLFTAGLGAFFTVLLLRGVRTGSRWLVAGAGAILGLIFLTRTYDTVVWAAAVGGFVVITERARWRQLLRLLPAFAAATLPALVIQGLHNLATTGSVTRFAISVADPLDTFGFGPRRMMPDLEPYDYTVPRAFRSTAKHLFFLPWFLVGAHLGALAALYGAWRTRHRSAGRLLIVLTLAFPLAYIPFWGIHISSLTTRISGPIYYIPAYIPLTILMVFGLAEAHHRRRILTRWAVVAGVVLTLPVGIGRLGLNRHLSRIQGVWAQATDDLADDTLIVYSPSSYLLFLDPGSVNDPEDPDSPVHATDGDPELISLIAETDRPAVVLTPSVPVGELAPSEHTRPFEIEHLDVEIHRGTTNTMSVEVTAPAAGTLILDAVLDGVRHQITTVESVEVGETVRAEVTLRGSPSVGDPTGILVRGPATFDLKVGVGADAADARRDPAIRHRLLVDRDPTGAVRVLTPGRFFRPAPRKDRSDPFVWLEDIDRGDLRIRIRAAGAAG